MIPATHLEQVGQALRVLILEDYPPDAELVILQLARDGIVPEWKRVEDRASFIETLHTFNPDLILSDYTVPGFGGLEALRLTRHRYPSIPLIIVTGSISEEAAVACMKEGAADYVIKENLSRLSTAVIRALEKRRFDEEKALVERELKLKNAAIDSAVDPIILADMNGMLTYANAAFLSLWGYDSVEDVRGKTFHPFLEPARSADELMAWIKRYGTWRGELLGRRSDGEPLLIAGSIGEVHGERGEPLAIMGGFTDIAERKSLEEQLYQSQKMEALGTLAGGIAHDFNNILSAIMGYSELAMEGLELESRLFSNLEQVYMAATRAASLVQQILTFSRSTEPHREPVYLQPILKETLKLLAGSVPSNVKVEYSIQDSCGCANVDVTKIHQTVMNLCVNALHAMRETGGVLKVEMTCTAVDSDHPVPSGKLPKGYYIRLSISDTGCGMDEKVKARIFEPFFTTKPSGEGTGLGLSTVHGIVKGYSGDIIVESAPGKGTRFDIYLPMVSPEETVTLVPRAPEPTVTYPNSRILLVDDEFSITQVYKYALERLGVEVEAYVESDDALAAFHADPSRFDLVLTDFVMPEKSGIDIAKEIRRVSPNIPILISSGVSENLDKERLQAIGISDIIQKPIGNDMLRKTVQRHL